MSDIAINPVTRRVQFTGNTGTGPYAFTFNILVDGDIAVFKGTTELTLTTDYTVSINANGTGSITLTVALIASDVLTIIGGRELSRTTDFVTAGDLLASSLNEQLDSNVIMTQQLDEKLGRGLFVNPGDVFTDLELPLKDDRKGTVLGFNATTGDPEPGPEIADVDSLANISADIKTLAEIQDGTVATDAITNVNTIRANVTTVSGISGNVTTVAGISSDVTTVAADGTDIGIVAGISSDVTTVSGISGNVTSVAGNASNINTVAADGADIGTVATSITNVNTVATDIANVNTNATNIASINTNATNITDIQNASANAASALASKNDAATSATNSANSATASETSRVASVAAQAAAETAETNAETAQTAAETAETNAAASETAAATSETNASTSAATATTQAGIATTKAGEAAASATASASSASASEAAKDAALAALDNFDDRYLGAKASDPTLDNDGNALVSGALYFNTTDDVMKVYDGSQWLAAYASLSGALLVNNNLSDLASASAGRTNLGLGTGDSPTFTALDVTGTVTADGLTVDGTSPAVATLNSTSNGVRIEFDGASTPTSRPWEVGVLNNTDGDFYIYQAADAGAGDIKFYTDGVLRKNIDAQTGDISFYEDTGTTPKFFWDASAESLGIGTASPSAALEIASTTTLAGARLSTSAGSDSEIEFINTSSGNHTWAIGQDFSNSNAFSIAYNNAVGASLSSNAKVVIDSSGRVGIGNSSPATALDVTGTITSDGLTVDGVARLQGGAPYLYLDNSSNTGSSRIYFGDADSDITGYFLYDHSSNSLRTGVNGSERMRLDASGRVMIGTTTEGQNQADNLTIADAGNMGMTLRSTDSGETSIFFSDGTSGAAEYAGWLGYIHSYDSMTFGTSGTESMRISSSGKLGINNSSPSYMIDVTAQSSVVPARLSAANGDAQMYLQYNTSTTGQFIGCNSSGTFQVQRGNDGTTMMSVDTSGTVSASNFNTTSDATLKTNVETLTGSLDAVKSLRGVSFDWLENGNSEVGVIAQEVEAVLPDVVSTNDQGIKSVKYGNMVALLIEAMKEQQLRIEALEAKLGE